MTKFEEHEQLLVDQLTTIKEELKETRQQRDIYKKKFEESGKLFDGKRNEVTSMIKQALQRLILEMKLTPKIKEILTVIMRVLEYSEEEIAALLSQKKANFLSIFK